MALARIARLNPDLFRAMTEQARTMYVDQVEEEFPWSDLVVSIAGLRVPEHGEKIVLALHEAPDDD